MSNKQKKKWSVGFHDRGMGRGDFAVINDEGTVIAKVETGMLEDADLLAAAPALLAACEALVDVGDDMQCELEGDAPHVQEMRKALDAGIAAIDAAEPKEGRSCP